MPGLERTYTMSSGQQAAPSIAGRAASIAVLISVIAAGCLFVLLSKPIRVWDGRSISAIEPENPPYTDVSLQLIRDRDEYVTSKPVLLFAHYLADDKLTPASRTPCASSHCACRLFVVIVGGEFDAHWFFSSGLSPSPSEPLIIDHIVFVYEFDGRGTLTGSGFRGLADGSDLWPLIDTVMSADAQESRDPSVENDTIEACNPE